MKRIAVIFLLLIPLILNGCGQKEPIVDQKIVLICRYIDYSDSFIHRGYYLDWNGNKVYFDLTNESRDYADYNKLYEYLLTTFDSSERKPFFNEEELKKCYEYLYSVDLDAEIKKEPYANDFGLIVIYGVRLTEGEEPIFIQLGGWGDVILTNTDENAAKIIDILGDDVWKTK